MIALVLLQVARQLLNLTRQQRHLNLGRARVRLVTTIRRNNLCLAFNRQRHDPHVLPVPGFLPGVSRLAGPGQPVPPIEPDQNSVSPAIPQVRSLWADGPLEPGSRSWPRAYASGSQDRRSADERSELSPLKLSWTR